MVGDVVVIAGVGVAGYNGTFTVTAVPSSRTFEYTTAAGLATSGGGTATFSSPFQVRIGANDSALIGGSGLSYTNANIQTAINAISGFAGTVTVSGAASTGFTVTYGGASAGVDVPNIALVNLSCGGCFASVEETNHGGLNDSFRLNYNGTVSAPITNGTNYTAAGILAALTPILPVGGAATGRLRRWHFQQHRLPDHLHGNVHRDQRPGDVSAPGFHSECFRLRGRNGQGRRRRQQRRHHHQHRKHIPVVAAPTEFTIPLRTPFALTGSATDADDDTLLYSWEQNDRGGAAGTSLLSNTKTNGPLFAMFPKSGQISDADSLLYESPGQNHLTTIPTRVFRLQQCSMTIPTLPPARVPLAHSPARARRGERVFRRVLPTADYVGSPRKRSSAFHCTSASP